MSNILPQIEYNSQYLKDDWQPMETVKPVNFNEISRVTKELVKNNNNLELNLGNVSVRQFDNVEGMKQSNNLKVGDLIKTQGFYNSGDGGGADYVIVDDIGEDEVDEASIITLQKGLYAKLLVQDYVNVKQMGAKGNVVLNKDWTIDNIDEATDDTVYINKAIEFAYNKGINVILPYRAYKIAGKILLYPSVTILPVGDCFFCFYRRKQ